MRGRPERHAIIEQLRRHGIRDARILEAFGRVTRARFVPPDIRAEADDDRPLPIGHDQTISQPFIVAVMTLELALTGTERVLEIGTGSGYQTAILADLAAEVFTIERHGPLSLRARSVLDGQGVTNVHYRIGDGTLGWPEAAPFDRILVAAAAPEVPRALLEQLADGGQMVLPVGGEDQQSLAVVRKVRGREVRRDVLGCRFVKLIGQEGWPG